MKVHIHVFCAAAMMVSLAGPAFAQDKNAPQVPPPPPKTQQEIENDRAAEKAYKNSLSRIPDKAPADPWGNVRGNNPPAADARPAPAKPRTKTGSNTN